MKVFFDSSAFAKRYIEEAGSGTVDAVCMKATELGLAVICVPEIISALNRRVREKNLARKDYTVIRRFLGEDIRDAEIIALTDDVVATSVNVLEKSPVRAMDALHVACAVEWGAELFVSADARQLAAARKAGLKCRNAG